MRATVSDREDDAVLHPPHCSCHTCRRRAELGIHPPGDGHDRLSPLDNRDGWSVGDMR
jgi:hypothetical protein